MAQISGIAFPHDGPVDFIPTRSSLHRDTDPIDGDPFWRLWLPSGFFPAAELQQQLEEAYGDANVCLCCLRK